MAREITLREHLQGISSRGGKARQDALSPAQRTENARAAADARSIALTKKERSEIASNAAKARWAKRKKKEKRP